MTIPSSQRLGFVLQRYTTTPISEYGEIPVQGRAFNETAVLRTEMRLRRADPNLVFSGNFWFDFRQSDGMPKSVRRFFESYLAVTGTTDLSQLEVLNPARFTQELHGFGGAMTYFGDRSNEEMIQTFFLSASILHPRGRKEGSPKLGSLLQVFLDTLDEDFPGNTLMSGFEKFLQPRRRKQRIHASF